MSQHSRPRFSLSRRTLRCAGRTTLCVWSFVLAASASATPGDEMPTPARSLEDFKTFLGAIENDTQHGLQNGRWMPYRDSKGLWTLGRGILIGDGSDAALERSPFRNGVTQEQENLLFEARIQEKANQWRTALGPQVWDKLDPRRRQLLLEKGFNLGVEGTRTKFPKFTAAVLADDEDTMFAEGVVSPDQVGLRNQRVREFFFPGRDPNEGL